MRRKIHSFFHTAGLYGVYFIFLAALLFTPGCKPPELVLRYAPIHYQDTDNTDYKADYISRIDYDGNWKTDDNWENLDSFPTPAWSYYSVVESCTHWFIIYSFYHPRDWTDSMWDQEHENDLEGLLFVVRKGRSEFGKLEGAITVFHSDFFSYIPADSQLTDGHEDIDGELSLQLYEGVFHPKTVQEAKGHGLKAWPYASDFKGDRDEDGIIYFPSSTTADVPESGNDRFVTYKLTDIHLGGLWHRQLEEADLSREDASTFAIWGSLKGDKGGGCGEGVTVTCKKDAANTPWGWDDEDDGPTYKGEMALDPAHLVDHYFNGLGDFSHRYIKNQYLKDLQDFGYNADNLPRGWPEELNIESLYGKLTTTCP